LEQGLQGTGENLALGHKDAIEAVDAWIVERKDYNFQKGDFAMNTGHFTQVVWKGTTKLGCAQKMCELGLYVSCVFF
jgi:hypothetical protein